MRSYSAEAEFARIEAERTVVNDKLASFTTPYVQDIISQMRRAAWVVGWACAWGFVLALLHVTDLRGLLLVGWPGRESIDLAPLLVIGYPAWSLLRLLMISSRMPRRLLVTGHAIERYADDHVAHRLENEHGRCVEALEGNSLKSVGALYKLLHLRLRGFRIWRRFFVQPFGIAFGFNQALRLPLLAPRFWILTTPIILLMMILVFNLGRGVEAGVFANAGVIGAMKGVLGLEPQAPWSAYPWWDVGVVGLALALGLGIFAAAHVMSRVVVGTLTEHLSPSNYDLAPYTYDCSGEIIDRFNTIRKKMVNAQHFFEKRTSGGAADLDPWEGLWDVDDPDMPAPDFTYRGGSADTAPGHRHPGVPIKPAGSATGRGETSRRDIPPPAAATPSDPDATDEDPSAPDDDKA